MLDKAVQQLRAHIEFDAMLAGVGRRNGDGSVSIADVPGGQGIAPAFISDYPSVAGDDVVGQLFAAYPHIVRIIVVDDYLALSEQWISPSVCQSKTVHWHLIYGIVRR